MFTPAVIPGKQKQVKSFFIAVLLFIPCFIHAQGTRIEIIGADLFEYNESGNQKIKTLTGNVRLRQNDVLMYCDHANLFEEDNTMDASGHVRIVQDTVQLSSDYLHYDGAKRKARFTKNVTLTDSKMVLTTDQLDYDLDTKVGNYHNGATLKNDSTTLTSQTGYYYSKTSDIYFKHEVKLNSSHYNLTADTLRFNTDSKISYFLGPTDIVSDSTTIYCEGGYYDTQNNTAEFTTHARMNNPHQLLRADSIYYEKQSGNGVANSNIFWKDSVQNLSIRCNYARYNAKTRSILATKQPLLTNLVNNDSMFVAADTLQSVEDTVTDHRTFFAYHHVKIFKSDLQALCDSVAYADADSTFRLFSNPVVWIDSNQLKADTILILLSNKKVNEIKLLRAAFVSSRADSGVYNQMKGKNMYGYFTEGEMKKLLVDGNGESVYYAKDDSGAYIGVNKIVCSNMTIYLEGKKVKNILFNVKPEGTMYPVAQAPAEEIWLKDFIWLEDKKPKSKGDLIEK